MAIEEYGCTIRVMKIKAHRDRPDVAEEHLEGWLGNEAADEWTKVGALDRNVA